MNAKCDTNPETLQKEKLTGVRAPSATGGGGAEQLPNLEITCPSFTGQGVEVTSHSRLLRRPGGNVLGRLNGMGFQRKGQREEDPKMERDTGRNEKQCGKEARTMM